MKILNLDKIGTKETRKLLLAGVEYIVDDMTVDNFIITTMAAAAISEEDSMAVQVNATIDMIIRSVPTIDRIVLGKLKLEVLKAIVSFIRGDEVEGVESSEETESGEEGDAEK